MGSNKNKTLPKMQRFAIVAVFAALVAEAEAHRRRWRHKHFSGDISTCIIGEKGELSGKISFTQSDTEGADTTARAKFWNLQTEETVDEVTTPAGVYTIDIRSGVTVADTDAGATNDECGAGTVTATLTDSFTAKTGKRNKHGHGHFHDDATGLTLTDSSVTGNWLVVTLNDDSTPVIQGCCQIAAVEAEVDSRRRLSD